MSFLELRTLKEIHNAFNSITCNDLKDVTKKVIGATFELHTDNLSKCNEVIACTTRNDPKLLNHLIENRLSLFLSNFNPLTKYTFNYDLFIVNESGEIIYRVSQIGLGWAGDLMKEALNLDTIIVNELSVATNQQKEATGFASWLYNSHRELFKTLIAMKVTLDARNFRSDLESGTTFSIKAFKGSKKIVDKSLTYETSAAHYLANAVDVTL